MPCALSGRREDEPVNHGLEKITAMLVASGKGILAADETGMEGELMGTGSVVHRREWDDD